MTNRRRQVSLLFVLLSPLFVARPAGAQAVSATLLGTVTDATGAVVPSAAVKATEVNTGTSHNGSTSAAGTYSIPYLAPGNYTVEITANGFKKFIREGVLVSVDLSVRVDAALEVGGVTEAVKVTGEPPLLQTDRAEITQAFNTRTIRELPYAARTAEAIVGLLPGVLPPTISEAAGEAPQNMATYRANGNGNENNRTQVDGVEDHDALLNHTIYVPQMEDVQEVSVTTSNYDAEFGGAGGAVVNIITRGGTNQFHGSLFEFWRGTNLAARNFFNTVGTPKPTFNRNEFGATIGGPIRKDQTFFFFAWQGRHLRQGSTTTNSVPVPAWRTGDFSTTPGINLFDPDTGNATTGTGRSPFPGNIVPANRFNAVAGKITPLLVNPNLPGFSNNYILNLGTSLDGNSYDGRIDHNFSDRTRIFVKFNDSPYTSGQTSVLGPLLGGGGGSSCPGCFSDTYTLASIVNLTHGFSPTLLSELRVGFVRSYADVENVNNSELQNQNFGIQNPTPDSISQHGLAAIQVAGMAPVGGSLLNPVIATNNQFQLANNWNKIITRHTLKWGVDVRRYRMERAQPQGLNLGPRGAFQFNSGPTALNGGPALGPNGTFGNSFAAFLLGDPNQTSRTFMTTTPTNRTSSFALFFNDLFQVTPRLTLNLGLRYELFTPVVPRGPAGASNYNPFDNTLLVAGVGGVGLNTGVATEWKNFDPRFGIAYRLNNKTVIRTGYGLSHFLETQGFTGGTLSTQFPVIYNVQVGSAGDYRVSGSLNSLPAVPLVPIPTSGIFKPAPDQAYYYVPFHNPIPEIHSYNFTVERDLGWSIVGSVGYVGNVARNLGFCPSLNTAPPGAGPNGRIEYVLFGRTSSTIERGYGISSNYNSLQTTAKRNFGNGLTFTTAFTYAKGMGYGGDQAGNNTTGFQNNFDLHKEYAPLNFDQKFVFVASHVYELPVGKGKHFLNHGGPVAYILGNWQWNGVLTLATGTPFSISADATSCNCPGNTQVADVLRATTILGGVGPGQRWFDTTAFAAPGPNRFGTAGLNIVRGPGQRYYNMSVFKNFPVRERAKIEFRTEFFNLTNSPVFANPAGNLNASNFGQISSASNQRNIQFSMRALF